MMPDRLFMPDAALPARSSRRGAEEMQRAAQNKTTGPRGTITAWSRKGGGTENAGRII